MKAQTTVQTGCKFERNPFLPEEAPEIQVGANPYQVAACVRSVIQTAIDTTAFHLANIQFDDAGNPYMTPNEFVSRTGAPLTWTRPSPASGISTTGIPSCGKRGKGIDKFLIELDGIYLRPKNPQLQEPAQLTNFDFHISGFLQRHRRDGSTTNEVQFVVTAHENEPQSIPYADFSSGFIDRILREFPDCCLIGNGAMAKAYLRELAVLRFTAAKRSLPVKDIYEYHGWETVGGNVVYLSATREDCECACCIPNTAPERAQEIWKRGMGILDIGKKVLTSAGEIDFSQTYRLSLPFFMYLHMGYASKLFQDAGLNLQFLLLIVGKSGSLKTSTCKAFAEPFHPGGMLRLESTPRALELYRESCIDQTMIADDIFCKNGTVMAKFEDILRAFGDEIGRAKSAGTDFNDIVRTKVRGGCIVTAENTLDSQQSSTLRYVTLKFEPDSIAPEVLRFFQENQRVSARKGILSIVQEYFAAWIHHLENNYDTIVHFLETFEPPPMQLRFKRHQQVHRAFTAIAALVLHWGVEIGAISEDERKDAYAGWINVISNLMRQNEEMAITAEPWQQFLVTLQAAIGTGAALLAGSKAEFEAGSGKFMGFIRLDGDEHEYVLSPEASYSLVKHQMQTSGRSFVSEPTVIYRDLFEHGIAKGYAKQANGKGVRNRYLKRVKLHDHLVEMLVISVNSLEESVRKIQEGSL